MAGEGVLLSEEAADLVIRAAKSWELQKTNLHGFPSGPERTADSFFARVTSATADNAGEYGGVLVEWDPDALGGAGDWTDVGEAVKVMPANGEDLTPGVRYPVRPAEDRGVEGGQLYITMTAHAGAGSRFWVRCIKRMTHAWCEDGDFFYLAEFDYLSAEGDILFTSDDECPVQTTHPCTDCPDGSPGDTLALTIDAVSNSGCSDCAGISGTEFVSRTAFCFWESERFTACGLAGCFWRVFYTAGQWQALLLRPDGQSIIAYLLGAATCALPVTLSKSQFVEPFCVGPDTITLSAGG